MNVVKEDIVLDESAFENASKDFEELSNRLQKLRTDIEDMLNDLKAGFDTPAGRKFLNSCEKNLFQPMDDQKLVLAHISETLQQSKQCYESIFEEYQSLQNAINQIENK